MLDIYISPQHNFKLNKATNQYSMLTTIVVEVNNKSIVPVKISNLSIVSKSTFFLSYKIKNEFYQNKNDILNPESSCELYIEGITFVKNRKYKVIINQEYISNEV
ncbi:MULTISPECIES: hypothetical protein [Chryseobacterium]|uniref:Uncharacterized protein n=3 Tax=Chryseobacterium TaxID=59732 RepID=A0A3M7LGM2_9FLAO|nr:MULTISPECIES: hypothetical protein [Chryseobacterium]RMZ61255.1 hypothetical protein D1632_00560 [Chryseobacterium nematophagum]RMZ61262.1 hypothetical protein D1632_00165 [Chryseobacterium nematophagum]RMZ61331.1 hypothetical protein D1632_00095 [Chryseobacterium nematophagum]CAA7196706.1 hypothetical protein CHRY9293_02781 [Chryseobacterium potabilaquae]CAA7392804.1 hypothetical protein CHRY9393_03407 [Chryseobacterium fistulae]